MCYPSWWSRRDSPSVSALLEQEGETCCILPVEAGGRAVSSLLEQEGEPFFIFPVV